MQFGVGFDNIRTEPCPLFLIAVLSSGAPSYHPLEIPIDGGCVTVLVDELLHGVTDMNLIRKDDEALQRTIPQRLFLSSEREPREVSVRVGQQQTVNGEVATHSHQSVFLSLVRVRKPQVII